MVFHIRRVMYLLNKVVFHVRHVPGYSERQKNSSLKETQPNFIRGDNCGVYIQNLTTIRNKEDYVFIGINNIQLV